MASPVITAKLTRGDGRILAQCVGTPAILVTGANRTEVRANLKACIDGFVQAFPDTRGRFFAGGRMKKIVLA